MTDVIFLALFVCLSILSSLVIEAVKSILDGYKVTYNTQTVSLIASFVIGIVGTVVYYLLYTIAFTGLNIFFIIIMGIATCIGAQVGYDKVVSTIKDALAALFSK